MIAAHFSNKSNKRNQSKLHKEWLNSESTFCVIFETSWHSQSTFLTKPCAFAATMSPFATSHLQKRLSVVQSHSSESEIVQISFLS